MRCPQTLFYPTKPRLRTRKAIATLCRKTVACLLLAASHNIWAANPTDRLEDFDFSPEIKIRIQSEAKDLAKAHSMPFNDALTVCTNYWIRKCKAKEQYGKNCKPDIPFTDDQFHERIEKTGDIFTGISCLQHIRWVDEIVRRNPEPFIPR